MRRYSQFHSTPERVTTFATVGTVTEVQTVLRRRYPPFRSTLALVSTLPSVGVPAAGVTPAKIIFRNRLYV